MLIRRANPASGFTMIEIMVTISIFAILVAVVVPTMRTWVMNNKVRAVSDALQTGLRAAQAESLRRSRQVVFALTNSANPTATPLPAVANGSSWAIYTLPSMTDNSEGPMFIQSGVLSNASANVAINSNAIAVCFNSVGRLVGNGSASVAAVTGGTPCAATAAIFDISTPAGGADRPLRVTLSLGGQVHMCDPNITLSNANPEGC